MRTVNIFKLERREFEPEDGKPAFATYLARVPNGTGIFHAWGVDSEDGEAYTTAIIEKPDGTVVTPAARMIQFTEPTKL